MQKNLLKFEMVRKTYCTFGVVLKMFEAMDTVPPGTCSLACYAEKLF